jgi:hypothetical protein
MVEIRNYGTTSGGSFSYRISTILWDTWKTQFMALRKPGFIMDQNG